MSGPFYSKQVKLNEKAKSGEGDSNGQERMLRVWRKLILKLDRELNVLINI